MHCLEWTSHVSVHANLKVPISESKNVVYIELTTFWLSENNIIFNVNQQADKWWYNFMFGQQHVFGAPKWIRQNYSEIHGHHNLFMIPL